MSRRDPMSTTAPSRMTALETGVESGVTWATVRTRRSRIVNGYVRVPSGHPWGGATLDELNGLGIVAPGGLTFAQGGWIGFDTGREEDYWPTVDEDIPCPGRVAWTEGKVADAARSLARQVADRGTGEARAAHDTMKATRAPVADTPSRTKKSSRRRGDELRLNDWFAGCGGSMQGAASIPGVVPVLAANHNEMAIASHAANFPDVEHFRGDIRDLDVATHPYAEIFWASPECTNWSQAKGKPVDFDVQPGLFGDPEIADDVTRSRALMQDVIRYLEGMTLRQRPVLAGVVENVTDIRKWEHWAIWRGRIERLGYRTRLIALNSMHAQSVLTPRAPQSRDRLYLAYWHESIGRDPDWDRWLRPAAWCPSCEQEVMAVQVWRRPGVDMGRYGQQYDYRCPKASCRGQKVEPHFVPAAAAIDWSLPGQRIGDRAKPLAAKTRARIAAGARRYARPVVVEAGGNQYDSSDPKHPQHGDPDAYLRVWPADAEPLKTLHTALTKGVAIPPFLTQFRDRPRNLDPQSEALRTIVADGANHAVVIPALLVPVEGREGKQAAGVDQPMRTQTARAETGVLMPPMLTEFHGGGSTSRTTDEAMATILAGGNHHGLVIPPLVVRGESRGADGSKPTSAPMGSVTAAGSQFLTVPPLVMRNNTARGDQGQMSTPVDEALRTITTAGHQSLLTWGALYAHDAGVRDIGRPMPTQTTVQGDALLTAEEWDAVVDDCLFRMLEPHEIHAGMAFIPDYIVLGSKRQRVRQLGNAVTPPAAEVLVAALVECITGEALDLTTRSAA